MTTPSRCVSHASTAACTQGATATTVTGWSVCPTHTGRQGSTHRSAPGATHSAGHATTASGYSGAVQPHMVAASSDAIPLQHQCLSSIDETMELARKAATGSNASNGQQHGAMSASLYTVLHSPCQWRPVSLHGAAQSVSAQAVACLCHSLVFVYREMRIATGSTASNIAP